MNFLSKTQFVGCTLFVCVACSDDPATAQLDNDYPYVDGGARQVVVYKAWWGATLFADPVAPGGSSDALRTATGNDTAYALLAPGWSATSTTPPTVLIPVRSRAPLVAVRGDALHVSVSETTFEGDCAAKSSLSQADADFITSRIFPGDFAGFRYDAKTCVLTALPPEAGANEAGD